jgi:hypothetical protein
VAERPPKSASTATTICFLIPAQQHLERAELFLALGEARVGMIEKRLALRGERSMHAVDDGIHGVTGWLRVLR